jgi:hypothetical protein
MSISKVEQREPKVQDVTVTADSLTVDLLDGRTIAVPLAWFPRLLHGTTAERNKWRLIGQGEGIHWPDLDEDISIDNLVRGMPSGESQRSFEKWLKNRSSRPLRRRDQKPPNKWHADGKPRRR